MKDTNRPGLVTFTPHLMWKEDMALKTKPSQPFPSSEPCSLSLLCLSDILVLQNNKQ